MRFEEPTLRRLVIAQTLPEIEALQPAWQWLHEQASETTLFQSFHWNCLAATVFRQEQPHVLFFETDAGTALIPAAIRNGAHLCMLGEELFDYRDVLQAGDPSVLEQAWEILADRGLPLAETPVRGPSTYKQWRNTFELTDFCKAPCAPCEITADTFVASHPKLDRQIRRLARAGAGLARYDGHNTALLREIYTQKAALAKTCGQNLFADERRVDFILGTAAAAPSACQVFTLESASTLAAALVTFQDRDVRRCYTTWFNPMWSRYSPGLALLFEVTRVSLAEGLACDYMTGEQDYKLRLATNAVPLYRAHGKIRNTCDRTPERELPVAS